MRLRILGTAAGGGLPQWNCGCVNCRAARAGMVSMRSQSSLAVSADGVRWALLNVSPDVRTQLAEFAPLGPAPGELRGSGVRAVVLTNADIDHAAGLLVLREGGAPAIYCTRRVEQALTVGLSVLPVLRAYGDVTVRTLEPPAPTALVDKQGEPLGLTITPFAVATKPPPYMLTHLSEREAAETHSGDTIGLVIEAPGSDGRVVYVPGVRDLDELALIKACEDAALVLIDGTTFRDDELVTLGVSTKTARAMGHSSLGGPSGTLAFLSQYSNARRVLVHVNNTNPLWQPDATEHDALRAAGVELGDDGMEFVL